MKTNPQRKNGAALVIVVLSMIAAGLVGTAILSKATSSRYERVQFGTTTRAYYLAESGASYVRARRQTDRTYFPQSETVCLTNGDRFTVSAHPVSFIATNADGTVFEAWHVIVDSTGIANPGAFFEARQRIHFQMDERTEVPSDAGLFSSENAFDFDLWNLQNVDPQDVTIRDTGPSDSPAVNITVDKPDYIGIISLSWTNNPGLNLTSYWLHHAAGGSGRLSYDAQLKMQTFENVPSLHYMMGLSFRLRGNGESYGLSFFRSMTNDGSKAVTDANRPSWARDANLDARFQALRGTNNHAVLWYRASSNAPFRLINSRCLKPDDVPPLVFDSPKSDQYELINYCTLLLQLDEVYADTTKTNTENRIVAYMEPPGVNPPWPNFSTTNAVWQDSTNHPGYYPAPLTWDQNPYSPATGNRVTNIDSRVTSAHFNTLKPPEIGIHVFYDRNAANETFFRDFALRLEGWTSPYGGTQIQW